MIRTQRPPSLSDGEWALLEAREAVLAAARNYFLWHSDKRAAEDRLRDAVRNLDRYERGETV